ncbi:hypothetical protein SAMN04488595_101246 [Ralstonia sp. 25mfcol4.1]|uniref:hypothetical protein n=1 Tax=Ralstonia sp. 25mfcol4.1 TaxID=1761899 RepID=UPI00087EBD9C|nr:hypothetical protein [Ralstonia sp. 25mfcol4.1]SDO61987.1 hypothetical protein SAMN04488595_101246 [Ralstonia sp. 25mfcol4.1]
MRKREARNVEAAAANTTEWLPPEWLGTAAATVWRETLASVTPGHFAQADEQLLADYCHQAAVLRDLRALQAKAKRRIASQRAEARAIDADVDRAARLLLALTRALRLSPVSRRLDADANTALPPSNNGRRHKLAPVHMYATANSADPYLP